MKTCSKCKTAKKLSQFWKDKRHKDNHSSICKECQLSYKQTDKYKEKDRERAKKYYHNNKEKRKQYNKDYRNKNKKIVLEAYGGKCINCGITNPQVLDMDHIDNNGAEWRRKHKIGGQTNLWLIKNNFPTDFQILCRNCNWIKRLESM